MKLERKSKGVRFLIGLLAVMFLCYAFTFGPLPFLKVPIQTLIGRFHHIHSVFDLPGYPSETNVRSDANIAENCNGLVFETTDTPERVQDFYLAALGGPDYGWYGDGSSYPAYNPITKHHVKHGADLTFSPEFRPFDSSTTQVSVRMCPGDIGRTGRNGPASCNSHLSNCHSEQSEESKTLATAQHF